MPRVSASERAATRIRLLEAAKREFAERGLAGARFDEIAVAAGRAKGTIYNYFPTREALFFAVVEEWCQLLTAAFDPVLDAREQLLEIVRVDSEIARKDPDLARVVVQHMPALSVGHGAEVDAALEPALEMLATVFAGGAATGELALQQDAVTTARLFLAIIGAIDLEALSPATSLTLDDVPELVDRHFVTGLVAR